VKKLTFSIFWLCLPAAMIVLLDGWLKAFALKYFIDESFLTGHDFVRLAVHKNWGLAFNIPFRREFILLVSFVIGYFLVDIIKKNWKAQPKIAFSSMLILIGAAGNLFDRIYYGFTVDYLIFFGRSAINMSDIVILTGVVCLLIFSKREDRS